MDERVVIVAYRPKPGRLQELERLMREHYPILHGQGLVTERNPVLMRAKDGTIIEVFGWKSPAAIEAAHANPVVLEMWGRYAEACEYLPVGQAEEAGVLFSAFAPFE